MLRRAAVICSVIVAASVVGCVEQPDTLIVRNRTTVPVVLEQYVGWALVVDACSERTITSNGGDWGGYHPEESVPPDVDPYVMPLPGEWLETFRGAPEGNATLLVTADGIGVDQEGYEPFEAIGGGSFPPDPGPATCSGFPPSMPGGWPGAIVKDIDLELPESVAGPLDPVTTEAWVSVDCVATDDHGVDYMQLWRRFQAQPSDPWGPWEPNGTQEACPFVIWLDAGVGSYEYATMATDTAGNKEALPAAGDAAIQRLSGPMPSPSPSP
jgi:hypothetical protein